MTSRVNVDDAPPIGQGLGGSSVLLFINTGLLARTQVQDWVVLIDDIGYVQQNRPEMEVLFALLADRYEKRGVMLTSNLPFSKWELIFNDPMTAAAAIDRLVRHSILLELNLPSHRLEAARFGQQGCDDRKHPQKRRES